jgi:Raf kinase inhibitor-like YbhB/YbcL family protein
MADLTVKSSAFEHNQPIPAKYTCDGEEINPPLTIQGVPKEAKSIVLLVDDPDAPRGTFDHWVMWNIPLTDKIDEDSTPGTEGLNGAGENNYHGPCPPYGVHRYFFKVYALDTKLALNPSATRKKEVEKAMQGHILAQGELMGTYKRGR